MRRRTFLQSSATLAAGAPLLSMSNAFAPAPTDKIVGHGAHRYRVRADWHQDTSLPVRDCHEMVQVPDGRLFLLTNHTDNNVVVYDRSGKVLDTWGSAYAGAHGLTLSTYDDAPALWITDEKSGAVNKHALDGRLLLELPYPEASGYYANRGEYKPTETTVGPDGSVYVADGYGKNYVHRYTAAGEYVSSFGGSGTGPAHLDCAHGVTLDTRTPEPTLLVTSRSQQAFKRYSLDGKLLDTYETPGFWVCRPVIKGDHTYFAVIVTDSWYDYDGLIAVFDKDMKLVSAPGSASEDASLLADTAKVKSDRLTFMNPHDVCVDSDENLYVPQWYSGRTYPVMLERV